MVKQKKRKKVGAKNVDIKKTEIDKQKDEIKKVYLCPKCKSKKVKKVFGFRTLFGLFSRWKCESCGYEDVVFPLLNKK